MDKLIEMGQEERIRLGLAARCRIRENFSLPFIVVQYEKLCEELSIKRCLITGFLIWYNLIIGYACNETQKPLRDNIYVLR